MSSTSLAVAVQPVEQSPPDEEVPSDRERTLACTLCAETRKASTKAEEGAKKGARRGDIPTRQLGDFIEAEVQRRAKLLQQSYPYTHANGSGGSSARYEVIQTMGVHERRLFAWRTGELATMSLKKTDQVLHDADLQWWMVWNEETVRVPILRVERRISRNKKDRHGKDRLYVERGWIDYGDQGPDQVTLRRIRRVLDPPIEMAAKLWAEGWEEHRVRTKDLQPGDYVTDFPKGRGRMRGLGFLREIQASPRGRRELFFKSGKSMIFRAHKEFVVLREAQR